MSSRHQVEWDWGPTPAPTGALRGPQTLCASVPDLRGFHASAVGAVSTSGEPPAPLGAVCHCPALQMGVGICQKGRLHPLPRAWVGAPHGVPPPHVRQGSCGSGLWSFVGIIGGHPSPPWVIRGADTQQGHLEATGSDSSARRCPPGERAPLPPPPPSSLLSGHVASNRSADLQVRSLPGCVS